jgi:hypothetical protein
MLLLLAGVDIDTIRDILGHASSLTTEDYKIKALTESALRGDVFADRPDGRPPRGTAGARRVLDGVTFGADSASSRSASRR